MPDPHVESLTYAFDPDPSVTFASAPSVTASTSAFTVTLKEGIVRFEMIEHFASAREAQVVADRYLRTWTARERLARGYLHTFEYQDATVIDRNSSAPDEPKVAFLECSISGAGSFKGSLQGSTSEYPRPPDGFALTPDVESLWQRYEGFREGREPLQSMSYFVLKHVEQMFGGGDKAARGLAVSLNILKSIGRLASTVGTAADLRKASPQAQQRALTGTESGWLDAAIRVLIRRV